MCFTCGNSEVSFFCLRKLLPLNSILWFVMMFYMTSMMISLRFTTAIDRYMLSVNSTVWIHYCAELQMGISTDTHWRGFGIWINQKKRTHAHAHHSLLRLCVRIQLTFSDAVYYYLFISILIIFDLLFDGKICACVCLSFWFCCQSSIFFFLRCGVMSMHFVQYSFVFYAHYSVFGKFNCCWLH